MLSLFFYYGAVNYNERGVYVSFAESRERFLKNMHGLGLDFESLEREGKFRFIDMLTVRGEAISAALETILKEVSELKAKRLVIDSFSAMAQAFKETHEARVILHTILGRAIRLLGCTTILIVEVPYGENRVGLGIEEFVADGIIYLMRSEFDGGRIFREMEILKMRGAPIQEAHIAFTVKGGLKALPPFEVKVAERLSKFEPRPDTKECFSTGSQNLDEVLNGGYLKGSSVLIEIIDANVSTLQYHLIIYPTLWNFLAQGRGAIIFPSTGIDYSLILKRFEEAGFKTDEINSLLRILIRDYAGIKQAPYLVTCRGENFSEDYVKILEIERELHERTGKPILHFVGADMFIDTYGLREALSAIRNHAVRVREEGDLYMILLKQGYPRLSEVLGTFSEVHLKITRKYCSVIVYGVKPRTPLYALDMDVSKGYFMPKLTQII
ncbi:MAG: ATPase domain-containing protein [Thermoproteota archaeon]